MKEKILQQLKTKYSNLGLSDGTLEGVASQLALYVKEDAGVEAAVNGAEPMLKSIQSFADSRSASSKNEAERLKQEIADAKAKLEALEKVDPKKPDEEMPSYMKVLLDKVGTLETSISGFNAERQSQSLSQRLNGMLTEKKVPAEFSNVALVGRTFKDEAEVNTLAEAIVGQYETFKQKSADLGFSFTAPPEVGKLPKSDSEDIAKMINDGTKQIVESQSKQ